MPRSSLARERDQLRLQPGSRSHTSTVTHSRGRQVLSGDRHIACVLAAAQDDPHAYRNRADDDQDAYELEARRVIGPSVNDGGDSERDGKDGNQVLHGVSLPRGRTPMLSGRGMDAGSDDYT